jgi:Protein tyrosine and serine/threonine kinase/C-terminal of Roc, COR, domain/Ras of Complex, Roc, domain of DAPkinase
MTSAASSSSLTSGADDSQHGQLRHTQLHGIDITTWAQIDDASETLHFNTWDFHGSDADVLKYAHKLFLTDGAIYVIVFNLLDANSVIDYWLESIQASVPNASILIVGTHSDDKRCSKSMIGETFRSLESKCKRFPEIKGYCAVSCVSGKNIDQLRKQLILVAQRQPHFGVPIQATYLCLADQIRALREVQMLPIINQAQLHRLATGCGVKQHDVAGALSFLCRIGLVTHFDADSVDGEQVKARRRREQAAAKRQQRLEHRRQQSISDDAPAVAAAATNDDSDDDDDDDETLFDVDSLSNVIVIDAGWLIELLSKMKRAAAPEPVALISGAQISQAWLVPEYPVDLHASLLRVLCRLEIGYTVERSAAGLYLFPFVLSSRRPHALTAFWQTWHTSQLWRIYRFAIFPFNLLNKLIVRLLLVGWTTDTCWQNGALLCKKGVGSSSSLMLLVDLQFRPLSRDTFLRLSIRGPNATRELLILIESVDTLTSDWLGIHVPVLLPCPRCFQSAAADADGSVDAAVAENTHLFSLKNCARTVAKGRQVVYCSANPIMIDTIAPDVTMDSLDSEMISPSDLSVFEDRLLGEGAYARVFLGELKGEAVAVKKLMLENAPPDSAAAAAAAAAATGAAVMSRQESQTTLNTFFSFRREVWLMSGLEHPNIVHLKGVCLEDMSMIMEFMSIGSLFDFIHNDQVAIDEPLRVKLALDIAAGMHFLHRLLPPLLHRDLKVCFLLFFFFFSFFF